MQKPPFMGPCKAAWCAAALAMVVTAAALTGAAAAQGDVPAEGTQKETKQPDSGKGKRATLTIEVFVVDPEKRNERRPAEDATVSIVGIEDRYRTNDKGRTLRLEIVTGKIALNIKVIGTDLCKLQDVSVVGGDQVVSVLVEKTEKGKCRRLE